MKSGELFAGVGGLGMAVDEVFDSTPAWFCEFDAGPSKVLAYRHPGTPNYGDVTQVDWGSVEAPQILAGGFPCQDVSLAGRRRGMKDGTRSGLWSHYVKAIDAVRPDWVVIENVRGLLSADAAGNVEPCPWCLGDSQEQHALRALGAVLGDLADLGFDAEWTGLPASSIGAPHGRFRVFILAWPRERTTANTSVGRGRGRATTPRRSEGARADAPVDGADPRPDGAPESVSLLPTPAAMNPNDGEGTETWLARRERVKATKKNGNGMGMPLSIAVQLLPTPDAYSGSRGGSQHPDKRRDGGHSITLQDVAEHELKGGTDAAPEGRSGEVLQCMRDRVETHPLRERAAGRSERVPEAEPLLETMREHEARGPARLPSVAGEQGSAEVELRSVSSDGETACASSRSRRHEQPPAESAGSLPVMPPEAPLAGGLDLSGSARGGIDWGPYRPAVERWERVLGRSAPAPVLQDGRGGKPRLNPALCEWMMGWPAGHVTAPAIGLTRAEQLKACGNGVVPQQAAAALRELLARDGVPAIRREVAA